MDRRLCYALYDRPYIHAEGGYEDTPLALQVFAFGVPPAATEARDAAELAAVGGAGAGIG